MNSNQAKKKVKSNIELFLKNIMEIDIAKNFNCLNPEHTDNKPSMSLDRSRNKVHCFGCNADYDTFDLIKIFYDIDNDKEVFKKGYEIFNIDIDYTQSTKEFEEYKKEDYSRTIKEDDKTDYTETYKKWNSMLSQTYYLQDRGISLQTLNRFNIGYNPNYCGMKAIMIPVTKNSYIARNTDTTSIDRYRKKGKDEIYNKKILKESNQVIFITEGQIDTLSIEELGFKSIALGSTSNTNLFEKAIKEYPNLKTNTFIDLLDRDTSGDKASQILNKICNDNNIKIIKPDILKEYNDPNDRLVEDKDGFKKDLEKYSDIEKIDNIELDKKKRELEEKTVKHQLQNFIDGITEQANTPPVETGFKELDKVLGGGLFEGLYFIGAISSLGKTTFTLQIADQIAQQNKKVMIFSLEMSKNELIAKSISRLTLENSILNDSKYKNLAKTTRDITTGSRYMNYSKDEQELIKKSMDDLLKYGEHITIIEGMGDVGVNEIRQEIEQFISITGEKPTIFIDYLQIIAPYNPKSTDKQNTDKSVLELKRLSRDFKVPIIAISSLNRENYKNEISMTAFKESGAIEYSSDILIGLQFKGTGEENHDIEKSKSKEVREVELKILKNRNGITGVKLNYEYLPKYNKFDEVLEFSEV